MRCVVLTVICNNYSFQTNTTEFSKRMLSIRGEQRPTTSLKLVSAVKRTRYYSGTVVVRQDCEWRPLSLCHGEPQIYTRHRAMHGGVQTLELFPVARRGL